MHAGNTVGKEETPPDMVGMFELMEVVCARGGVLDGEFPGLLVASVLPVSCLIPPLDVPSTHEPVHDPRVGFHDSCSTCCHSFTYHQHDTCNVLEIPVTTRLMNAGESHLQLYTVLLSTLLLSLHH